MKVQGEMICYSCAQGGVQYQAPEECVRLFGCKDSAEPCAQHDLW
jgi:hypothetical protein